MHLKISTALLTTIVVVGLPATVPAAEYGRQSSHYGREVEAPPYSFACMTDHGPSDCREPMWVYGDVRGYDQRPF
jgi:hypothetical protein